VALAVEQHQAADPRSVRLGGAGTIVADADGIPHVIEQAPRPHGRRARLVSHAPALARAVPVPRDHFLDVFFAGAVRTRLPHSLMAKQDRNGADLRARLEQMLGRASERSQRPRRARTVLRVGSGS